MTTVVFLDIVLQPIHSEASETSLLQSLTQSNLRLDGASMLTFQTALLLLSCCIAAMIVSTEGRQLYSSQSLCSENLPQSQRIKRNCSPLKPMKLQRLTTVTCNDGSAAGYYFRRRAGSRNWLIYLEGGGYCYNKETCKQRKYMSKYFSLVSLRPSSKDKLVSGILSTNKNTNPLWWNANHVYVPYCSSDIWTGNNRSNGKGFSFLGARIIDAVVDDLWKRRDLTKATNLTMAGSSAGGTGVMFNIDRVGDNLEKRGSKVDVRGIVDSGWFLDNDRSKNCAFGRCKQREKIRAATRYWNADLPERCTNKKSANEKYMCLFASEIYPTLKSEFKRTIDFKTSNFLGPVFIFQWIYDFAQIIEDNPDLYRNPMMLVKKGYFHYMANLGKGMRGSLQSVRSYFAPSCLGHTVLTREHWMDTRIGDKTLEDALNCWLKSVDGRCQMTDRCTFPHCSKYCSSVLETGSRAIPIRVLPSK
eukprot:gene579-1239_t